VGAGAFGLVPSCGLVMAGSRGFAAGGMGECRQDNFGLAKRGLGAGLRGRSRVHARREACAGCRRAFERGSHALDRFVSSVSRAYLKSKDTRLSSIVLFCEAVGKANFLTIVEKLTAKEVVTVLSRVDPRHASKAKANPAWARMRLAAVLTGEEVPALPDASRRRSRIIRRSTAKPHVSRSVIRETDAFSARRREKAGVATP
jgi:hypothetical protein